MTYRSFTKFVGFTTFFICLSAYPISLSNAHQHSPKTKKIPVVDLIGGPGTGKGTLAKSIVDKYKCFHMSAGELLRAEVAKKSEIGKQVANIISKGNLVDEKLMTKVLVTALNSNKTKKCIIFDGYPRSLSQAKGLNSLMKQTNLYLASVINLTADEQIVFDRLLKRAKIEGRADDNEVTIKHRIEVYNTSTKPILSFFGNKVVNINTNDGKEKVWNEVDPILSKILSQ